jgi:prevent-host-death family protein
MAINFGLLSMTDFRNRPGEILDRVADGGESFIIERGGHRKACLVPLSIFLPDISPTRIASEIGELVQQGEKPRATFTESRELAFRFSVTLTDDQKVDLEIILPHGYPNLCPRVYARAVEANAPHRWRDGALCIYGVLSAWNPGKHTTYTTLNLARQWVRHYDVWRKTRKWPQKKDGEE